MQVVVAFASTDFILWSLGGLVDVADTIRNQGAIKVEEIKRRSVVALKGDDLIFQLPTERWGAWLKEALKSF